MRSFFKRSAISLAVLGMTGSVYANAFIDNNSSWSPQLSGVFIGVEGLDLRPMNGDLDYVTLFPTSPGNAFNTQSIHTSYDWGWRAYGGIRFTDNDDITVSWMQLHTSNSDSIARTFTTPVSLFSGFSTPRWFEVDPWENVYGRVTFNLNDAYAVWGHTVNFNNPWTLRLAGGVEFANIRSNMRVTENAPSLSVATIGFASNSSLNSIGPRIEMDATYHLPKGFALFANVNGALLVGNRDISLNPINENDEGILSEALPFFDYTNRHVVVPKAGLRLGASYSYVWGQVGAEGVVCSTTSLTVDVGWQAESYVHAIERPTDEFSESSPVLALQSGASSISSTKTSNFSNNGFFVGIQLGTNWM